MVLTSASTILPFSIQESFPITINANSTINLTLLVDSSVKYNNTEDLNFDNDDADPLRNMQNVLVTADVYAVNEITIGTGSGESNTEIEIPVLIDNMEPFTGFQFDISLPEGIDYVSNSIIESTRFDGHAISANIINGNILRFLAYSASNNNFLGTSGEVFSFKLNPDVASGTYPLIITNAILSNVILGDILSDVYNGSIQINSPNLSLNPSSISYGDVPITETRETTIRLTNTGSALLTIDEVIYAPEELSLSIQLPLNIAVGAYEDVNLTFTPLSIGEFSESISFRHNGPDEQNLLPVLATKFSPNFVMVESQEAFRNETNNLQILLKNNDAVKAVQFDMELPIGFDFDANNIATTDRTIGFSIVASNLSGTTYRVILYSTSNIILDPGDQSIIELPIFIANDVALGTYTFNFTNVIISDVSNQNISSIILEDGEIILVDRIYNNPKAFLQGPYDTGLGLMSDNLRVAGLIPTTSPYTDALTTIQTVFNLGGTLGTGLIQDDIVDWVWVELRDAVDYTIIVAGKSALLQRDGDIVDSDGISNLSMDAISGSYYVVINHRNHLGIMSATPLPLTTTPTFIDFTANSATIFGGSNAIVNIDGSLTMIGGDYDSNKQVQNTDITGIIPLLGGSGYSNADIDMNGQIQNTDINNIVIPNTGKGEQF